MKRDSNYFSCLAVDMGAGSIRIMLGTIKDRQIEYKEIHRVPNEIIEIDGHERWDVSRIFSEIVEGVKKAIFNAKNKPVSIGVDSWGVDYVLLDKHGDLVDVPVAYRDKRTEGMIEKWKEEFSALETFKHTGINFYRFNTLFQLLSMQNSESLKKTRHILFIPSYINYLLCGVIANEQTISSTSQILNINGKEWDEVITEKLRISKDLLGSIVVPGTKLGPVKIEEVKKHSIETIAICGHDTACAVAAIPAASSDFVFISTGTWCILGVESEQPLLSLEAFNEGFTNERGYDNTFRSLKNIVGLWLIQGLKKQLKEDLSYGELEDLVNRTDQTYQFIDADDPMFFNPQNMQEAFDTFFEKTDQDKPNTIAEYVKIAYDSLCFAFKSNIESLEQKGKKKIDTIHVIGGGCQSDYFNQRIATICQKKVLSGPVEGAVIGNIITQAISMGHLSSLKEGRKLLRESIPVKSYSPEPKFDNIENSYKKYLNYKIN